RWRRVVRRALRRIAGRAGVRAARVVVALLGRLILRRLILRRLVLGRLLLGGPLRGGLLGCRLLRGRFPGSGLPGRLLPRRLLASGLLPGRLAPRPTLLLLADLLGQDLGLLVLLLADGGRLDRGRVLRRLLRLLLLGQRGPRLRRLLGRLLGQALLLGLLG